MYTRILVPLDGSNLSEEVLPYVRLLAKGLRCPIELLRVVEPVPSEMADPSHGLFKDQLATSSHDITRYSLGQIMSSLKHDGIKASVHVHEGRPEEMIVSEAASQPSTLIAMTTHGRSGMARWLLGSVTDKVLHASTEPIVIVRSNPGQTSQGEMKLERLIVALDGSPLAEQAIPHVVALARGLNLGVDLLRITPSQGEYYGNMVALPVNAAPVVYHPSYKEHSERTDKEAETYLHGLRETLLQKGIGSVGEHLIHGHPAESILKFAQETPNSLVAMTTHGRSGLGRWLLGSVASRVVSHSGCPVLLVRSTDEKKDSATG